MSEREITIEPFAPAGEEARKEVAIKMFDTTLRDGEQGPGAGMTPSQKLLLAEIIADTGMDRMELGFPRSGEDFQTVQTIVRNLFRDRATEVCGLARADKQDIQAVIDAIGKARNPFIHTFISTSPMHRRFKLQMDESQVLDAISSSVEYAVAQSGGWPVEWSPEDACRTEPDFLVQCVRRAIEAGASRINMPDTVGHGHYGMYGWLFEQVIQNCREEMARAEATGRIVEFSAHCHNDRGTALPSSLEAIKYGATQIEGCTGAMGERAGNVNLIEIVAWIDAHGGLLVPGKHFVHGLNNQVLIPARRAVARVCGVDIPDKEPISGAHATAHGAGIHTDGASKDPVGAGAESIYNVVNSTEYGGSVPEPLIGSRAGRADIVSALEAYGINLEKGDTVVKTLTARATEKAAEVHGVTRADVLFMYSQEAEALRFRGVGHSGPAWSHQRMSELDFQFKGIRYSVINSRTTNPHHEKGGQIAQFLQMINAGFCQDRPLVVGDQDEHRLFDEAEIRRLFAKETGYEDHGPIDGSHTGGNAKALCTVTLGENGHRSQGKVAGENAGIANLEALFIAAWPFIRKNILAGTALVCGTQSNGLDVGVPMDQQPEFIQCYD